jgi:UDP-glucose 4-epimerase
VADHLTNKGFQVTIYDKIKSQWLRQDQEMVVGDVEDGEKINQTIAGAEVVYNFAALADLNEALKQPIKTVKINILGNLNVMEACRAHGIKRFIYASTVYVHSREGGFYRCSKQTSEAYVEEYQRVYGLNYTILRDGSLYGSRADDNNGINRIVKSAVFDGVNISSISDNTIIHS